MLDDLHSLISATRDVLYLPDTSIEKDIYVTHALHALSDQENEYFKLSFQGGTCLAKAHRVVERMSEDADFRIETKKTTESLSKNQLQVKLRDFRYHLLECLKTADFKVTEDQIRVRDSGNFMRVNLPYESLYAANAILRPSIQIEFIAINSKLPTVSLPITTLIKNTLGDKVNHLEKSLDCLSLTETAAEKWVAFTRRAANTIHRGHRPGDAFLVRHLYDLYCMQKNQKLNNKFYDLVGQLIDEDKARYENFNVNYYSQPIQEIKNALEQLPQDPRWQTYWDNFMVNMVFDKNKPKYQEALQNLLDHSHKILRLL